MENSITALLAVLADDIFHEGKNGVLEQMPEPERNSVLELSNKLLADKFIYYYHAKSSLLPDAWRKEAGSRFRAFAAGALQREMMLREIKECCVALNAKMALMKGCYMAECCYIDPALRPMSDLDILMSKEDGGRLFALLKEKNWRENEHSLCIHHFPMLAPPGKYRFGLEIHHQLGRYNFSRGGEPIGDAVEFGGSYVLPPELALGLMVEHADQSHWRQGTFKLLFDAAFLLKKYPVDRQKYLHFKEKYFFRSDPAWLFGAFPEFFGQIERVGGDWSCRDAEAAAAVRVLMANAEELVREGHEILVESNFKGATAAGKLKFLLSVIHIPAKTIRCKYRLPADSFWRLPYYYMQDYWHKGMTFFAALGGGKANREIADALKVIKSRK